MDSTNAQRTERRVAKMARRCAKVIGELRREGHLEAAQRLQAAAIEAADLMRAGKL